MTTQQFFGYLIYAVILLASLIGLYKMLGFKGLMVFLFVGGLFTLIIGIAGQLIES